MCFYTTQAQSNFINVTKVFYPKNDTVYLDSLSIVKNSIVISNSFNSDSLIIKQVNIEKHFIILNKKTDSLLISYQRFPFNFEKIYFNKNIKNIGTDLSLAQTPYNITYNNKNNINNFLTDDALSKNGNISRGISFGTTQDVVVNSNLNLQVSGKLSEDINILMAATDNNIPFQADGTTAQLQEFDKVYIQLNNKSTKMIVGDFQLSKPKQSYFLNYYKRAQGLVIENNFIDSTKKHKINFNTRVSGSVSKGKFSRMFFYGIENNQGPYRLKGANNETFIIVLSGTERIYIDGKLLLRGQENDYIIDYNTGEITFTARQIITKDKRIVCEFQYAERNYGRSLFIFDEEISLNKTKFYLSAFSEQDNKNRSLQQNLTQIQKNTLIAIGDTLSKAYSSGVEETAFNSSDVFYLKKDTTVNTILYKDIFVYSINPDSAKYRIKFSNVGNNNGNYIQVTSSANGRVYKWVAPISGILQGNFEPIIPLVTPKQTQMLVAGVSYSNSIKHSIGIEGAYTKNDINTFSTSDKGNDEAGGFKFYTKNNIIISEDSLKRKTLFYYNANHEYIQNKFNYIERYRTTEFDRDWNRALTGIIYNDQNISNGEIGLIFKNGNKVGYAANMFTEGTNYSGLKNNFIYSLKHKNFSSNLTSSLLNSNDQLNFTKSEFYRHKSSTFQKINKIKLGFTDDFEHNLLKNSISSNLKNNAYQFWEWEGSISNADSAKTNYKIFYKERRDKLAYSNELKDSTYAQNIGAVIDLYSIKNNPIKFVATYRNFQTKNLVGTTLKPDNTLLNRIEYNPRYFKGLIVSNLFYESGYGLENKKEFYYLEVAPGQGQYTWVDYNDNKIKELNEFEIAQFSDQAKYIRIYTPTNQYIKVLQNQFSLSTSIRPSSYIKKINSTFKNVITRFIFQLNYRLDNKNISINNFQQYNPFYNLNDSLLLAKNNNIRGSIFFNQSSQVFGLDYVFMNNQSRQLLVNGIENKELLSHEGRIRLNFFKAWALNSINTYSQKGNKSQLFSSRNYLIESYKTENKLSFQPTTNYRVALNGNYEIKQNLIGIDIEKSIITTLGIEGKYNQTEKGSLNAKFDYIQIIFNGNQNSSVGYEMLNALSNGSNYTWEVSYERFLNKNIQISINYNGRKNGTSNIVHLGGAQVRAYF